MQRKKVAKMTNAEIIREAAAEILAEEIILSDAELYGKVVERTEGMINKRGKKIEVRKDTFINNFISDRRFCLQPLSKSGFNIYLAMMPGRIKEMAERSKRRKKIKVKRKK